MSYSKHSLDVHTAELKAARRLQNVSVRPAIDWCIDIPVRVFMTHAQASLSNRWQARFDCALWLSASKECLAPIMLWLEVTDQQGEQHFVLDKVAPGNYRSILLNACPLLELHGRVKVARLGLSGVMDKDAVARDLWHFIPQIKRELTLT